MTSAGRRGKGFAVFWVPSADGVFLPSGKHCFLQDKNRRTEKPGFPVRRSVSVQVFPCAVVGGGEL